MSTVLSEVVPKDGGDRHDPPAGKALRRDEAIAGVPRALDAENPVLKVDVGPSQCPDLAEAEASVKRRRPYGAVALQHGCDQLRRDGRLNDPIAPSAHHGELDAGGRVDDDLAADNRPPVEHPERDECVAQRRRVEPAVGLRVAFQSEALRESLQVTGRDVAEPPTAEIRKDVEPQRLLVRAHHAGLVPVTRAVQHGAVAHPGKQRRDRRRRRASQTATGRSPYSRRRTPYEQFGGASFFTALVADFSGRVAKDPVVRALYPGADLGSAEERLRMFLEQYWSGPAP